MEIQQNNKISEVLKSLNGFNSRIEMTEEKSRELKDRPIEYILSEEE